MDFLENVFVDMGTEISSQYCSTQIMDKPKRSAFIFITTDADNSHTAIDDLRKIDEIKEVYLAHGAYDIIAKVSGESFENLREIVHKRIEHLSSIKSTLTLTII
jgi:DNA-binding Lrp family transcriptional regulator